MRKAVAISSGHGKKIRGASGIIDEVDEARRVVPEVVRRLQSWGVTAKEFHDDVSTTQQENLERIVDWHNAQQRELDVSVHFNAYIPTEAGRGTEVLYVTQTDLAGRVALGIANASGLINRGAHARHDLYFLNHTEEPAILIEVCFVDSQLDCDLYNESFDEICEAIARAIK